jgi:hypothetical protein
VHKSPAHACSFPRGHPDLVSFLIAFLHSTFID